MSNVCGEFAGPWGHCHGPHFAFSRGYGDMGKNPASSGRGEISAEQENIALAAWSDPPNKLSKVVTRGPAIFHPPHTTRAEGIPLQYPRLARLTTFVGCRAVAALSVPLRSLLSKVVKEGILC